MLELKCTAHSFWFCPFDILIGCLGSCLRSSPYLSMYVILLLESAVASRTHARK